MIVSSHVVSQWRWCGGKLGNVFSQTKSLSHRNKAENCDALQTLRHLTTFLLLRLLTSKKAELWRLITLQYCSGFCHALTWISHGFACVPHPDPPSHLMLWFLKFSLNWQLSSILFISINLSILLFSFLYRWSRYRWSANNDVSFPNFIYFLFIFKRYILLFYIYLKHKYTFICLSFAIWQSFFYFYIILKVTFHLQSLQNIGYIPHVIQLSLFYSLNQDPGHLYYTVNISVLLICSYGTVFLSFVTLP